MFFLLEQFLNEKEEQNQDLSFKEKKKKFIWILIIKQKINQFSFFLDRNEVEKIMVWFILLDKLVFLWRKIKGVQKNLKNVGLNLLNEIREYKFNLLIFFYLIIVIGF